MKAMNLTVDGNLACSQMVEMADILELPRTRLDRDGFIAPDRHIAPAVAVPSVTARPASRSSRFRALIGLTVVGFAAAAILAWGGLSDVMPASVSFEEITVEPGDSLWSIASEHVAPGADISRTVEVLRNQNDLVDATLRPGMELLVPVAAA